MRHAATSCNDATRQGGNGHCAAACGTCIDPGLAMHHYTVVRLWYTVYSMHCILFTWPLCYMYSVNSETRGHLPAASMNDSVILHNKDWHASYQGLEVRHPARFYILAPQQQGWEHACTPTHRPGTTTITTSWVGRQTIRTSPRV